MSRSDRSDAIADGVRRKLSARQIAEEIDNCTRNMVIGHSHRSKVELLPQNASAGVRGASEKKEKATSAKTKPSASISIRPKVRRDHLTLRTPTMKKVVEAPPVLEFPDEHYRTHLEQIMSGQCRWPLWSDELRPASESLFYCGKPVKSGSPWCHWCHKKGFAGFPSERKRDPLDRQRRGQLA